MEILFSISNRKLASKSNPRHDYKLGTFQESRDLLTYLFTSQFYSLKDVVPSNNTAKF